MPNKRRNSSHKTLCSRLHRRRADGHDPHELLPRGTESENQHSTENHPRAPDKTINTFSRDSRAVVSFIPSIVKQYSLLGSPTRMRGTAGRAGGGGGTHTHDVLSRRSPPPLSEPSCSPATDVTSRINFGTAESVIHSQRSALSEVVQL